MPRPAFYPLPLVAGSKRPSRLRCASCFHVGAAVRVDGMLLCGQCFRDHSLNEEAERLTVDAQRGINAA